MAERCDSGCSIFLFDILTKICFICINHAYLEFRTRFLLISINITNTNEADFRKDYKWQDIAPWVTPFYHFVLALKSLSSDRSQSFRDASYDLFNTKNPIDSQCNDIYDYICLWLVPRHLQQIKMWNTSVPIVLFKYSIYNKKDIFMFSIVTSNSKLVPKKGKHIEKL